jgi:hypothetical protein
MFCSAPDRDLFLVQADLYRLTCTGSPVPTVLFRLSITGSCPSYPATVGLSRLSSPGCLVLVVLAIPFCSVQADLSKLTCQADLSWLSCPGSSVPEVLSRLSCHDCPVMVVLSRFTCPSCPVLAITFWPSFPLYSVQAGCQADLSKLTSPVCPV